MGRFIFATAVGVWLGTVVSFSFVMLPTVHAVLDGRATALLDHLFPRYYMIGLLCGLTALAAVSLAPTTPMLPFGQAHCGLRSSLFCCSSRSSTGTRRLW